MLGSIRILFYIRLHGIALLPWLQLMSLQFMISTFRYIYAISVLISSLLLDIFVDYASKAEIWCAKLLASTFLLLCSFFQRKVPLSSIQLFKSGIQAWHKSLSHQSCFFNLPSLYPILGHSYYVILDSLILPIDSLCYE